MYLGYFASQDQCRRYIAYNIMNISRFTVSEEEALSAAQSFRGFGLMLKIKGTSGLIREFGKRRHGSSFPSKVLKEKQSLPIDAGEAACRLYIKYLLLVEDDLSEEQATRISKRHVGTLKRAGSYSRWQYRNLFGWFLGGCLAPRLRHLAEGKEPQTSHWVKA